LPTTAYFFVYYRIEAMDMELAKETMASAAEIRRAMGTLRLGEWADDLLDEIELDRRLEISLAQADRGEIRPADMIINEILEKLKNDNYGR
jgi:hypothetical protein